MYNGEPCSESELVLLSHSLTWYTRVLGSNPKTYTGKNTFLAKGGFIEIDHLVDMLLENDSAIKKHNRLWSLDHDGLKTLVRTLVANGTYEVDLGVRNRRYGMVEYSPLLTVDWQHPRPHELTWIFCRQGHANYDKLYVCEVSNAIARLNETSSLTAGSGTSSLTAGSGTSSLTAGSDPSSLTAGSNTPKVTSSVKPIREWKGNAYVDSNFTRVPFLITKNTFHGFRRVTEPQPGWSRR